MRCMGLFMIWAVALSFMGGPGCGLFDGSRKALVKPSEMTAEPGGAAFSLDETNYERLRPLLVRCRIRSMGSGALNLAYSAVGMLDGCIDFKIKVWDIAAAHALLSAGGGELRFLDEPCSLEAIPRQPAIVPYYAGTHSFCNFAEPLFSTE